MAENVASAKELKLVEKIKEQGKRIEQLENILKSNEILIQFYQKELNAKENFVTFRLQKITQTGISGADVQLMSVSRSVDAEKTMNNENFNARKNLKEESDSDQVQVQVNQPKNSVDSDSEVSAEAAVKAVKIPLILNSLLKNMKSRDLLKSCRLVSREWRDLATAVLLRRSTFQVEFQRMGLFAQFIKRSNVNDFRRVCAFSLQNLTTFLITSKTFPCAHFVFHGDLKSEDAQAFLSQFGSRVKGVKIMGPQNLTCIRKLLLEQIPNLERLQLAQFVAEITNPNPNLNPPPVFPAAPQAPSPTTIFPQDGVSPAPQIQLTSLTSLKVGKLTSTGLVREILQAAPNLVRCWGISSAEEFESLRHRIHVVKGLNLKPGERTANNPDPNRDFFPTLAAILKNPDETDDPRQLHLTHLEVDYSLISLFSPPERALVGDVISLLLISSKTSLKKVKLTTNPNYESLIQWRRLENVKKLTFSGNPTPVEVSKIFPKLHTVLLWQIPRMTREEVAILRNRPPIPTVKHLVISFDFGFSEPKLQILEVFLPLFPKMTHLSLKNVEAFANIAPIIWQKRGLKSLELDFDCASSEIDAGFTGIKRTTCRFLRTSGSDEFEEDQVGKFRVKPSILDATELEKLFLVQGFSTSENYAENDDDEEDDLMTPTVVSFKYAFNLMPKLQIFPHRRC